MRIKFNRKLVFPAILAVLPALGLICFEKTPVTHAAGATLTAEPSAQTVTIGQPAVYTIKINRDGFADKVSLSATGLPAGVTAEFESNPTAENSSVLTLKTSAGTPAGTFSVTVKGAADGISIEPVSVKLETRPAASVKIAAFPALQSIIAGQETSFEIALSRANYEGPVAFAAEDVPSGVTVKFEPQETTGNSTRMKLYSNGLPNLPADFGITVVAVPRDSAIPRDYRLVRLKVNCDIAWSEQFAFPDNQAFNPDFATDVAYDTGGNIYVTGISTLPNSAGSFNLEPWVAKYNANGGRIWLRPVMFNGQNAGLQGLDNNATDVAVDGAGNVYVAGWTQTSPARVEIDMFIAKFDQNGVQQGNVNVFGYRAQSSLGAEDGTKGMVLRFDAAGNPVLTAVTNINRGVGGVADFHINRYVFDANLNITGGMMPLIANFLGEPYDLAVGDDNSIFAVGQRNNAAFAARFNGNNGNIIWEELYNRPNSVFDIGFRVAVDADENAFVADFSGSWLIKYRAVGGTVWTINNLTGPSSFAVANALAVDADGDIFYGGHAWDSLAATNPNAGAPNDPNARTDAWLAKRAGGDGRLIFVRQFAVNDKDGIEAIKIDPAGKPLLAGHTVNFNNVNYGFEDALLMKYSPNTSAFYQFLAPTITGISPTTVRRGGQFTITGRNLSGVSAVFFDGQYLQSTSVIVNGITEIRATAPVIGAVGNWVGTVSISDNCHVHSSPMMLTVTP